MTLKEINVTIVDFIEWSLDEYIVFFILGILTLIFGGSFIFVTILHWLSK